MAPVLKSLPILDFGFEESVPIKSAPNCKLLVKEGSIFDPFGNCGPRFPSLEYDLQLSDESNDTPGSTSKNEQRKSEIENTKLKVSESVPVDQQMKYDEKFQYDMKLVNMPSLPVLDCLSNSPLKSNTSASDHALQLLQNDLHMSDDESDDDSNQRLTGSLDLDDHSPKESVFLNSLPAFDDDQGSILNQFNPENVLAQETNDDIDSKSSSSKNKRSRFATDEIVARKPSTTKTKKDIRVKTDRARISTNSDTSVSPSAAKNFKSGNRSSQMGRSDNESRTRPILQDRTIFSVQDTMNNTKLSHPDFGSKSSSNKPVSGASKENVANNCELPSTKRGIFRARNEIVKRKSKDQNEQRDTPHSIPETKAVTSCDRSKPRNKKLTTSTLDDTACVSEENTGISSPLSLTTSFGTKNGYSRTDSRIHPVDSAASKESSTNNKRSVFKAKIEVIKHKPGATLPKDKKRRRGHDDVAQILLNSENATPSTVARLSLSDMPTSASNSSNTESEIKTIRRSRETELGRKKPSPGISLPIFDDDVIIDAKTKSAILPLKSDLTTRGTQRGQTGSYLSNDSANDAVLIKSKSPTDEGIFPVFENELTGTSFKLPSVFRSNPGEESCREINLSEESDVEDDPPDEPKHNYPPAVSSTNITITKYNTEKSDSSNFTNSGKVGTSNEAKLYTDTRAAVSNNSELIGLSKNHTGRKTSLSQSNLIQVGIVRNNKRKLTDTVHPDNSIYHAQRNSWQRQPLAENTGHSDQVTEIVQHDKKKRKSGKENFSESIASHSNSESGYHKKRLSLPNHPAKENRGLTRTDEAPSFYKSPNGFVDHPATQHPTKDIFTQRSSHAVNSKSNHNLSPANKMLVPPNHSKPYSDAQTKPTKYVRFSPQHDVRASYQIICEKADKYRKEMLKHEAMVDRRRKAGADLESIPSIERDIFKFRGWLFDQEYLKEYLETYSFEVRTMMTKRNG